MNFSPSPKELKRYKAFHKKHLKCRPKKTDAMEQFDPVAWVLSPIGIGTVVKVVCPYCGAIKDITDTDLW